jgi:hypothetical protein
VGALVAPRGFVGSVDSLAVAPPLDESARIGPAIRDGPERSAAPERIAPTLGMSGAVAFSNNARNMHGALTNRFLKQKHVVHDLYALSYSSFVMAHFVPLFGRSARAEPVPFENWLLRFPDHRRASLRAARERLGLKPTRNDSGAFVKREVAGLTTADQEWDPANDELYAKAARGIAPQDEERLTVTGPVDAGFHIALKAAWRSPPTNLPTAMSVSLATNRTGLWYYSGTPPHVCGDNHRYHETSGHALRESDGSRFEACMNESTDAVERYVMERFFADSDSPALRRYFDEWHARSCVRGKSAFGQAYAVDYTRASGDTATTTRNSLTNGLTHAYSHASVLGDFPGATRAYAVPAHANMVEITTRLNAASPACPATFYLDAPPSEQDDRKAYDAWVHSVAAACVVSCAEGRPGCILFRQVWSDDGFEVVCHSPAVQAVVQSQGSYHILVCGDDSITYSHHHSAGLPRQRLTASINAALDRSLLTLGILTKSIARIEYSTARFVSADFIPCERDGCATYAMRQQPERLDRRGYAVDLPAHLDRRGVVAGNVLSTAASDAGSALHEAYGRLQAHFARGATPVYTRESKFRMSAGPDAGPDHPGTRPSQDTAAAAARMLDLVGVGPDHLHDAVNRAHAIPANSTGAVDDPVLNACLTPMVRLEHDAAGVVRRQDTPPGPPGPLDAKHGDACVARVVLPAADIMALDWLAPFIEELIKLHPTGRYLLVISEALCWAYARHFAAALILPCLHACFIMLGFCAGSVAALAWQPAALPVRYFTSVAFHMLYNLCYAAVAADLFGRPRRAAVENLSNFYKALFASKHMPRNGSAQRSRSEVVFRGGDRARSAGSARSSSRVAFKHGERVDLAQGNKAMAGVRVGSRVDSHGRVFPLIAGLVGGAVHQIASAAIKKPRAERSNNDSWRLPSVPVAHAQRAGPADVKHNPPPPTRWVDRGPAASGPTPAVRATPGVGVSGSGAAVGSARISGNTFSAPVAIGNTYTKGQARVTQAHYLRPGVGGKMERRRCTMFENTELIGTVNGSTSTFDPAGTAVNPGNVLFLPWLANALANFDEYSIVEMRIEFVTEEGTAQKGKLWMAFDYECTDAFPVSRPQMEDLSGCISGSVWKNMVLHYRPNAAQQAVYFVGSPAPGGDPRLNNPANFVWAVADTTAETGVIGSFRCTYKVCAYEPNLVTASSGPTTNAALVAYGGSHNGGAGTSQVATLLTTSSLPLPAAYPPQCILAGASTGLTLQFYFPCTQNASNLYVPTPGSYLVIGFISPGTVTFGATPTITCNYNAVRSANASGVANGFVCADNIDDSGMCMARVTVQAGAPTAQPPNVTFQWLALTSYAAPTIFQFLVAPYTNVIAGTMFKARVGPTTIDRTYTTLYRRFGELEVESRTTSESATRPSVLNLDALMAAPATADTKSRDEKAPSARQSGRVRVVEERDRLEFDLCEEASLPGSAAAPLLGAAAAPAPLALRPVEARAVPRPRAYNA